MKHVSPDESSSPANTAHFRYAILPMRLFLGVTFIYAAIQKLMDPGFFQAGSASYIGSQILRFSRGSPIQFVLHHLMQFAVAVGALTILTEGAIGVLVLIGLLTRPAALVGMALSTGFFLSASWGTYPYFFGSDIVFVMCWLTIALTGPGAFALDSIAERPILRMLASTSSQRASSHFVRLVTGYTPIPADNEDRNRKRDNLRSGAALVSRGEALIGSAVAIGFIALGLHPRPASGSASTSKLAGGTPAAKSAGSVSTHSSPSVPAGAKKIGNISQLPVNSAGTVVDPKTGDPAVIIHAADSKFYAYDAVCTHAGCTVQYDPQQRVLACPCHGGIFDPEHGAQVLGGPPPAPLTPIDMSIDPHGDIYIV